LQELGTVAQRRGLEDLPLAANASMLRVLDLPVILEVRLPGTPGTRWATMVAMNADDVVLILDGAPTRVASEFLERHWLGQAHVLWRDFEALGPTPGIDASGAAIARLQALLRRAGVYDGPDTGRYDSATASAVLEFQRGRLLMVDGRVGRLTRIVLYAAAGGYPR